MFLRLKTVKFLTFCVAACGAFATQAQASESVKPAILFEIAGLPITNTMLTAWIFAILLIIFLRFILLRGGAKIIPSKGQMFIEDILSMLKSMLEPVMGKAAFKGAFPILLGIFFFVLAMNWTGLLPGVGSIGQDEHASISAEQVQAYKDAGFHVSSGVSANGKTIFEASKFTPFIRPATSDYNTALALALISFVAWFYFVMRYAGPTALAKDWFANKADKSDTPKLIYFALFPIFFAVGLIEVISALIRPISLSCRLFGNVFGGEVLLESMYGIAPYLLPVPFCLLELLVGLVQALIFTLLTAVYIGLITNHEDSQHSEH